MEAALVNASSGVALNPLWFPKYWLGLSTVDDWPYYSWDDGVSPGPDYPTSSKYYRHWGSFQGTAAEPNEAGLCAVADYLEGYSITKANQSPPSLGDTTLAWGWNDQHCNMSFPYICQYPPQREWPGTVPAHTLRLRLHGQPLVIGSCHHVRACGCEQMQPAAKQVGSRTQGAAALCCCA